MFKFKYSNIWIYSSIRIYSNIFSAIRIYSYSYSDENWPYEYIRIRIRSRKKYSLISVLDCFICKKEELNIRDERIFFLGPNTNTNIFVLPIFIRIRIWIYSYCGKNIRIYSNIPIYSNIRIYSNISIKTKHSFCLIPQIYVNERLFWIFDIWKSLTFLSQ